MTMTVPESVFRDGFWWVPVMDTRTWLAWERRREAKVVAKFPKAKGAIGYDVYFQRGGVTVLDVYVPSDSKPVLVGRFDKDGNPMPAGVVDCD